VTAARVVARMTKRRTLLTTSSCTRQYVGHLLARDDLVVAEGSVMGSRLDAGERFRVVGADAGADHRMARGPDRRSRT
jgi:hypothetical protein